MKQSGSKSGAGASFEDAARSDEFASARRAALSYLVDAFTEAELDGLEIDYVAHAAIFVGLKCLVEIYGEDAVADFAAGIPERARRGDYTVPHARQ